MWYRNGKNIFTGKKNWHTLMAEKHAAPHRFGKEKKLYNLQMSDRVMITLLLKSVKKLEKEIEDIKKMIK